MANWTTLGTKSKRELQLARAFLLAAAEPPAQALAGFVAEHGPCRAVGLIQRDKAPPEVAAEVEARRAHVSGEQLLADAEAVGARLVVPEDPEWPQEAFTCLSGARSVDLPGIAEPLALWVRGKVPFGEAVDRAVAVVGARAASGYGEHVAAEFGHSLATAGFTVVSGAAYGIDGAAHRGALAAGGSTVAFLACGVDIDYPAGHGRLLRAIADQGAVVSEYAPGTPPRKHRFLVRNRLIAAAGHATVVVEAGVRSGAANTANTADTLGRQVLAVPGPVTSQNSVGCHGMVRSGQATLVTRADEVLEALSPLGAQLPAEIPAQSRQADELNPHARRLHDALTGMRTASAEDLARDSGLPLGKVRALLPELELTGYAKRTEGGWSAKS